MKYIVQVEIDPDTGVDVEAQPDKIQELMGKWQALNPIGMYLYTTRRAMTMIVDVPNEDALFEALHATHAGDKARLCGRLGGCGTGAGQLSP